jgi:hypothetical protein
MYSSTNRNQSFFQHRIDQPSASLGVKWHNSQVVFSPLSWDEGRVVAFNWRISDLSLIVRNLGGSESTEACECGQGEMTGCEEHLGI